MKILIAVLLLAGSAFAAEKQETIHLTGSVSVTDLSCVVPAEPQRERFTVLGGIQTQGVTIFNRTKPGIVLDHKNASKSGCDMEKLAVISEKSRDGFGFIHEAPIEVVKMTSKSQKTTSGRCVATYVEVLNINLGSDQILTSRAVKQLSMNDCE